jgi:hypothetical protein
MAEVITEEILPRVVALTIGPAAMAEIMITVTTRQLRNVVMAVIPQRRGVITKGPIGHLITAGMRSSVAAATYGITTIASAGGGTEPVMK